MRQTLACRLCICVFVALACAVGGLLAAEQHIPPRVDPLQPPRADAETLALWHFEGAADAGVLGNACELAGGAQVAAGGRFGKALRLGGGRQGAVLSSIKGLHLPKVQSGEQPLSVSFWMRFDALPQAPQCVLELASSSQRSAVRLQVEPSGKLTLSGDGLQKGSSEGPAPVGEWFHVALVPHTDYWPSGAGHAKVLVRGTGVAALLNGHLFVTAVAENSYYRFPPGIMKDAFVLGNSLALDAGFCGSVDEFHLSAVQREYYPVVRQQWLDSRGERPVARPAKFFRRAGNLVQHESFDSRQRVEAIGAASGARMMEEGEGQAEEPAAVPPVPNLDAPQEQEDVEGLLAAEKDRKPAAVGLEDGVKGKALVVKGVKGGARLELPEGLQFTSGTIEFLFKPGDWDNLHPAKRNVTYANARLNLLTLYGKPKSGQGEPRALLTLNVDRVRSDKAAPEFDLFPNKWTHVVLVWGEGVKNYQPNYYADGQWVGWDLRHSVASVAKPEAWKECTPAFFKLGDFMETSFDELRVYDGPWEREVVANACAEYTGAKMEEIPDVSCAFDYHLSMGKMLVGLRTWLDEPERVASARVELDLPHLGKTVSGETKEFTGGEARVELDVGELPVGDYAARCVLLDKEGKQLARAESAFHRADIPWLHNKLGVAQTPPPPFTPVAVKDGTVSCVSREHRVGPTGLFESIRSGGEDILARPMSFELVRDGKKSVLEAAGAAEFGEQSAVAAAWKGTAKAPGIEITSAAQFEYDGMTKYTLEVRPTNGPLTVERLSLKMPLREQYGHYLHALPLGGDFRNYEVARYLPAEDGLLWDSKSGFAGKPIEKPTVGNFIPMVWLGGMVHGLCWFADNDKGWVPCNDEPAIAISRDKDVVTIALNFISRPYELKSSRRIVFGLLATPSKPLPADHRLWNRGNNEQVGVLGGPLTSCDAFKPWRICPRDGAFDYWPKNCDWEFAKRCVETERKFRPNDALMVYTDKMWGPVGADGAYFGWEWKSGARSQWCWVPSLVDCWLWYMDHYIGDGIYNGLYIDDAFPNADFNTETGSAYLLDDGRMQPGTCFFGFREYLKRLRSVFHAHQKRSLISVHMTSTIMYPALSFADLIWDGEDSGRFGSTQYDFLDVWPLERMHVLDNPERTGMVTMFMYKAQYAPLASGSAQHVRHSFRAAYAGQLLHDFALRSFWVDGSGACLKVVDEYKSPDVTFHPYWGNASMVSAQAALKEPLARELLPRDGGRWRWSKAYLDELARNPLKVSLWRKRGRVLIVVVNFARQDVLGSVRLDLDALNVPQQARAGVKMQDMDDWPKLPEELTKAPLPPTEGGEGDEGADLAREIKQADENKDRFVPEKGEMVLTVPAHDFRLVEVSWED